MATQRLDKVTINGIASGSTMDAFMRGLGGGLADPARSITPSGYPAPRQPAESTPAPNAYGAKYFTEPFVIQEGNQSRSNIIGALRTGFRNALGLGAGTAAATAAPSMLPAHTPGELLTQTIPTSAPAPQATPGARRVSARSMAQGRSALPGNPPDPPVGFGMEDNLGPRLTAPLITENTDAAGVVPAALQAAIEVGGNNGGFGFTTNPDGTVGKLLTLRQRTAAEDAARPREFLAPDAPAEPLRPGMPGWAGSQAEWEQNQALQALTGGGPLSATQRGQLLLEMQRNNDTAGYNKTIGGATMMNAVANQKHLGTSDYAALQKLSPEIAGMNAETLLRGATANRINTLTPAELVDLLAGAQVKGATANRINTLTPAELLGLQADALLKGAQAGAVGTKEERAAEALAQKDRDSAGAAFIAHLKENPGDLAGAQVAFSDLIDAGARTRSGQRATYIPGVPGTKGGLFTDAVPAVPPRASWSGGGNGSTQISKAALAAMPRNADGTVTINGVKYKVN